MDKIDKNAGLPVNQFLDLAGRGSRALDEKDLDELRRAADAFEAIFVAQFVKTARAAKLADDVFGNQASETYQSMLDDQYSRQLASSANLGIAEALVSQLGGSLQVSQDK
jgi:flagellar protein FlgJ